MLFVDFKRRLINIFSNTFNLANELKFVFDSRYYFDSRRKSVSIFKFESDNKLIQSMKFPETQETQVIVRELNVNGQLVESLEMNGVLATRIFKKN